MPNTLVHTPIPEGDSVATIYSKIRWRIAPFLILLYIAAFLDRVNISFASLSMNRDLKISDSLFGLGAGIFFIGYLVFAIPSNIMLLRFGARRWIAVIMVAWGLLSSAMAFVHGAPMYVVLRSLLGAAEAGFFPGIVLYLTRWLPSGARAAFTALFVLAIPLSNVIGAPLSNWILSFGGQEGLKSWQWLFLIEGIPAAVLGVLVLYLLSEGPQTVRWLTGDEKEILRRILEEDQSHSPSEVDALGWTVLLRKPLVLGYAAQYFVLMIGLYALGFWISRILTSRGVLSVNLGWLTAVPFAVGAAGMLVGSWSSDRLRERKWHLLLSFLCASLGMVAAAPARHWAVVLAGLSLSAAGVFSAMPIFWTAVTQGVGSRLSALAIAFVNSVGNVGGLAGPLMIGSILQRTGSYTDGLLFTGSSLMLGALLIFFSPARPVSLGKGSA